MSTAANLLELAKGKFGALSLAEERLFKATQTGERASALTFDEAQDDPAGAEAGISESGGPESGAMVIGVARRSWCWGQVIG